MGLQKRSVSCSGTLPDGVPVPGERGEGAKDETDFIDKESNLTENSIVRPYV